jgi:hypothetical protein
MGAEQGQGSLVAASPLVLFLDENHCRNRHVISAIEHHGIRWESHLDHFAPGTEDTEWLPEIGRRGWALLTTDARIRSNFLEREAVRTNRIRMFYFSRNNLAGMEMGVALLRAIPAMLRLVGTQAAPFTASISRSGEVKLRDSF